MTRPFHDERLVASSDRPAHWQEPYTGRYLYNHASLIEMQRSVLRDLWDWMEEQDQVTPAGVKQRIDQLMKEPND
jgi:hypothetical protein